MGKWFNGIFTALVLLTATSMLGALLKGPIDNLASQSRLKAEVQLSPWYPKPTKDSDKKDQSGKKTDTTKAEQDLTNIVQKIAANSPSSGDFQFARIIITNESSKPITNANLRIDAPWTPEIAVLVDVNGKSTEFEGPDRIIIPDTKPGDRITVFMWGSYYNSISFPDAIHTYSSEGKFRIRYDWPKYSQDQYDSQIGQFIDDWAGIVAMIGTVLIVAVLGVYAVVSSNYYKALLKSEKFCWAERNRFEADPKKFKPSFDKAEEALKSGG